MQETKFLKTFSVKLVTNSPSFETYFTLYSRKTTLNKVVFSRLRATRVS